MTSEKRDTAKNVADFDPQREGSEKKVGMFALVTITDDEGRERELFMPRQEGQTDEDLKRGALEYAHLLRRVDDAWRRNFTPEEVTGRIDALANLAAHIVVGNLVNILFKRFPDAELDLEAFGDDDAETFVSQAEDKHRDIIRNLLLESDPDDLAVTMEKQIVARVVQDVEKDLDDDLEGYDEAFTKAWREQYEVHALDALHMYAQDVARTYLEDAKPSDATFEQVLTLLRGKITETHVADTSRFYSPVDRNISNLARYVGGKLDPEGVREVGGETYLKLPDVSRKTLSTSFHVRYSPAYLEVVGPENVEPVLARIQAERNETKAKTLVAAFGLASDTQPGFDPASFSVDLHEFITLVTGYQRSGPAKTQSRRYWTTAAEILRYLHVDLASLEVNIRVVRRTGKKNPPEEYLGEYLMHRPRLIGQQPFAYEGLYDQLRTLIVESKGNEDRKKQAVAYLRELKPTSVVLGFPPVIMQSFGREHRAIELTNPAVLKLKGATFWLAYEITFQRRWSKRAPKDGEGSSLLEELEKHGFLEESARRTGGRVSYSAAVSSFLASVSELVTLGELEEPGVQIWQPAGDTGRPKNVTRDLRTRAGKRSQYITEADLRPLKVAYQHRAERREAIEDARKKASSKKKAGSQRRTPG